MHYYVRKLRQNVGLETWKWPQIVTSQTANTKYKWPPYDPEPKPPMKVFCVRHWRPGIIEIEYALQVERFNHKRRQLFRYKRHNMLSSGIMCYKLLQHENFHIACHVVHNIQLLKAFRARKAALVATDFDCKSVSGLNVENDLICALSLGQTKSLKSKFFCLLKTLWNVHRPNFTLIPWATPKL